MRCVPYRDLADGQEFKQGETASIVLVKVGEEKYCLKSNPDETWVYESQATRKAPLLVWIE